MRTKERFNLFRSKYSPWLPFRMLLTSFNHSLRSKNQQPPRHQTSYIFMVAKFWQPFKCTVVSMHNQKHVRLARFVVVVKIFIWVTNGPAYLTSLPACRVQKASVLPDARTRWRDVGFMRLSLSSSLYDWLRLSVTTAASSPPPPPQCLRSGKGASCCRRSRPIELQLLLRLLLLLWKLMMMMMWRWCIPSSMLLDQLNVVFYICRDRPK